MSRDYDVKAIRTQLGYSQKELADKIGVERITIIRWEARKHRPDKRARRWFDRLLNKGGNGAGTQETQN